MGCFVGRFSANGVLVAKKCPELPESMMVVIDVLVEGPSAAVEICLVLFVTVIDNFVESTGLSVLGSPCLHPWVVAMLAVLLVLRGGRR